jgi:hypothetical protein
MTVHREREERTDFIQADSRRLACIAHSSGREKAESMGNSTPPYQYGSTKRYLITIGHCKYARVYSPALRFKYASRAYRHYCLYTEI